MTKETFIVCAHWGMVKTARRGVQSMQSYYVNDKFVGTRVQDVKAKMPKGFTHAQTRELCDKVKWDGSEDYEVFHNGEKWDYRKVFH